VDDVLVSKNVDIKGLGNFVDRKNGKAMGNMHSRMQYQIDETVNDWTSNNRDLPLLTNCGRDSLDLRALALLNGCENEH